MTNSPLVSTFFHVNRFFSSAVIFLLAIFAIGQSSGRSIAYFYALDADWRSLNAAFDSTPRATQVGTRTVYEIVCGSDHIFAVKMEPGCVESAISAQTILALRKIDFAISVGPVGALAPDLKIGDWTVVERAVPWQKASMEGSDATKSSSFEFKRAGFDFAEIGGFKRIAVASGEQFVSSTETRNRILEANGCEAVDMNLFGIAAALQASQVPSIHVRVVSDRADESAGKDFRDFASSYTGAGGTIAAKMIRSLPSDCSQPSEYPNLKRLFERRTGE